MAKRQSRTTFRDRLDHMVTTLRNDILTGKRVIGDYLPSETALGEQFQLSKNSVRKGLEILVSEGFIIKKPRMGNMVTKPLAESASVRFGYYPTVETEAQINQLIMDFHKEYPNIRVQTVSLPIDGYHHTVTDYLRNNFVDVLTINYTDYRSFVEKGSIESFFEPLKLNPGIYPFLSRPFIHEGVFYVQPFIFSPTILCYNRNHFREKNVPEPDSSWTWNDLTEVANQLADPARELRYGFYFYHLASNRWINFLLQSGMKFEQDETGKYRICGTKLMEGLKWCRELISKPEFFPIYLSESDADVEQLFLQEKVSMIMTTYFNLNHLLKADVPFDVSPLPHLYEPRTLLLIIGLAVNRQSNQKEAAQTLIDYLVSRRAQLKIRQETYSIPSLRSAAEWVGKETIYRPARFHMYREIVPTFRLFTDTNLRSDDLEVIHRELKLFWSRLEDDEIVCQRLEQSMKKSCL
ncbi:extracellular solute-binding protein [Paenactinomyces guangxiensis]|uniref:Extracellular solute-binding protein n=1 Tax=Paenactinomyces guangxiensis TaxID=1490290 RepID=A0A7W1WNT0_9BACL|nr:extracellular solute-binding protein [Paenactinomyces guangxiensis]MBA4493299.1 extracellular solute-binding protein [Paenactinomyces guangxiensis]MBH8589850.1 extracellular solute-binding protein [Paenactinomyces guangxiensis]